MIFFTGYAGASEVRQLVAARREELLEEFPSQLVSRAENSYQAIDAASQIKIIEAGGAGCFLRVGDGGILQALWNLGVMADSGLNADMRLIPVSIETVEITEFYDYNPYRMESEDSVLYIADGDAAEKIQKALADAGVVVSCIGQLTKGADRVVTYDANKQYLTPPQRDDYGQRKDT